MKKWYFYVITRDCKLFHSGYCSDIIATIKKYKELPAHMVPTNKNGLVYLQEHESEETAKNEAIYFIGLTKSEKEEMIEKANPEYIELIPNVNITL